MTILRMVLFFISVYGQAGNLCEKMAPESHIGVAIYDLSCDRYIYQKDATKVFIPASVQKIFTTAVALLKLGEDHRFTTSLYAHKSDYHLRFGGDSQLDSLQLKTLEPNGDKKAVLHIHMPLRFFPPYAPGWSKQATDFCYAPPVSWASIDNNTISFKLTNSGDLVSLNEDIQCTRIIPKELRENKTNLERHLLSFMDLHITMKGCVDKKDLPLPLCLPVPLQSISTYLTSRVRRALSWEGPITVTQEDVPQDAVLIRSHTSDALVPWLSSYFRRSYNAPFDSIYTQMCPSMKKWKRCGDSLKRYMEKALGITLAHTRWYDGSGLSYFNYTTPQDMVSALRGIFNHKKLYAAMLSLFPVVGGEGTLKKRFSSLPVSLHVKTGQLYIVRSIAGYVFYKGRIYAIAFMVNGVTKPTRIYDTILTGIIRRYIVGSE